MVFGIHWVMLYKVSDVLASWQGKFGRHQNIGLWGFVPHYLFWCLWRERNARFFEDCEWSILDIKFFFFHTLLEWSLWLVFFNKISHVTYPKKKLQI